MRIALAMSTQYARNSSLRTYARNSPFNARPCNRNDVAPRNMNSIVTHCAAGENAARLESRVENPPVDTVAHAWNVASNSDIPPTVHNSAACITTKPE